MGYGHRQPHPLQFELSNGGLGINLHDNGPTANDPGDADVGSNNLQNFPLISSARTSRKGTFIRGTLNSRPGPSYTIQLFSNPSGNEGKVFRAKKSVTDNDGDGVISFTLSTTTLMWSSLLIVMCPV